MMRAQVRNNLAALAHWIKPFLIHFHLNSDAHAQSYGNRNPKNAHAKRKSADTREENHRCTFETLRTQSRFATTQKRVQSTVSGCKDRYLFWDTEIFLRKTAQTSEKQCVFIRFNTEQCEKSGFPHFWGFIFAKAISYKEIERKPLGEVFPWK